MSAETIFQTHLVLGYVAWLFALAPTSGPGSNRWTAVDAQRVIATLHSFRFFGLVFILPGVSARTARQLRRVRRLRSILRPDCWRCGASHFRVRPLFWAFVVAFNLVGATDLVINYYHAIQVDLPATAGEFGATYAIPIIYVPLLMITHVTAFYRMVRHQLEAAQVVADHAVASGSNAGG